MVRSCKEKKAKTVSIHTIFSIVAPAGPGAGSLSCAKVCWRAAVPLSRIFAKLKGGPLDCPPGTVPCSIFQKSLKTLSCKAMLALFVWDFSRPGGTNFVTVGTPKTGEK